MAENGGTSAITESSWDRARGDTVEATKTLRFWFFDAVLGIVVATATLLVLLKWGPGSIWIRAGIPPAVGIAWLLIGVLAIFVWHLFWAPYRQRNFLREYAQELLQAPEFPDVKIEKTYISLRKEKTSSGVSYLLVVIRNMRITNRSDQKVSLGFKMNLVYRDGIVLWAENIKDPKMSSEIAVYTQVPPFPTPLNLDHKLSTMGILAFGMHIYGEEQQEKSAPADLLMVTQPEIEVTDYLTGTRIIFNPESGYPPPSLGEEPSSPYSAR